MLPECAAGLGLRLQQLLVPDGAQEDPRPHHHRLKHGHDERLSYGQEDQQAH